MALGKKTRIAIGNSATAKAYARTPPGEHIAGADAQRMALGKKARIAIGNSATAKAYARTPPGERIAGADAQRMALGEARKNSSTSGNAYSPTQSKSHLNLSSSRISIFKFSIFQ